jgi:hypothetical protein
MVHDGTFAIDRGVARWGTTADVSPHAGHHYSNKAPGSSMLAVPAYLVLTGVTHAVAGREPTLGEMTWAFRLWTGIVPTLLFLWLLAGFLPRFALSADRAPAGAGGLRPGLDGVRVLGLVHRPPAVGGGHRHGVDPDGAGARRRQARPLDAGGRLRRRVRAAGRLPGGCSPALPIAAWATVRLIQTRRGWKPIAWAIVGAAVPIAILLLYHRACFGSPWKTGYDASETFAFHHQKGFLGLDELRWEAFTGSTVAGDNGLVVFMPAFLLALPGWAILWRRGQRGHAAVSAAIAVMYLAFISALNFWRGGWQFGPRYITVMLPFSCQRSRRRSTGSTAAAWWRAIGWGAVAAGVAIYAIGVATFPHYPEKFKNPLYEVSFRLLSATAWPRPTSARARPGAAGRAWCRGSR